MSLYINFENQSLLWNIIHKNAYANQFFINTPNLNKEEWFKSIIQNFYSQNQSRNLTINELQKVNQDTLLYMLESIRKLSNQQSDQQRQQSDQQRQQSDQQRQQSDQQRQQSLHNLSDKTIVGSRNEHAFNIRQKEYDQMLEKKAPENVNFTDVVADQAISNMDELVQQHIKQRENELRAYAPQLKIDKTNENVKLVIDETVDSPKKTVTWTTDNEIIEQGQLSITFYEEFLTLKNQVLELSNRISFLEQQNK